MYKDLNPVQSCYWISDHLFPDHYQLKSRNRDKLFQVTSSGEATDGVDRTTLCGTVLKQSATAMVPSRVAPPVGGVGTPNGTATVPDVSSTSPNLEVNFSLLYGCVQLE